MELKLNREFALRHLGVAILFLGLSGWFGYDGFVRWPATTAHDIYVEIEKSEPKPGIDLEAFKQGKIRRQYDFTVICLLASLLIALGVALNRHRTLVWDEKEMCGTLTGNRPLAFADIAVVDDSQWTKKGILVVRAKDGRRVTLDSWHHAGVNELAEKLLPAKTAEVASAEPPGEQAV